MSALLEVLDGKFIPYECSENGSPNTVVLFVRATLTYEIVRLNHVAPYGLLAVEYEVLNQPHLLIGTYHPPKHFNSNTVGKMWLLISDIIGNKKYEKSVVTVMGDLNTGAVVNKGNPMKLFKKNSRKWYRKRNEILRSIMMKRVSNAFGLRSVTRNSLALTRTSVDQILTSHTNVRDGLASNMALLHRELGLHHPSIVRFRTRVSSLFL